MTYIPHKQQGLVATLMSILLLLSTTMLMSITATNTYFQTKLTNNEYRVTEAFEAAEAGLGIASQHLMTNKGSILVDTDDNGFIDAYTNAAISNVTQANGTNFTVSYSNPNSDDMSVITISSTGTSADGSVSRTVVQITGILSALEGEPPAPLVAKGGVNLSGNLRITNTETDMTVWSGDTTAFSGSADTLISTGVGSDSSGNGADIIESDPTISALSDDEFFEGFFTGTKTEMKAVSGVSYTNSVNTNYNAELDGLVGEYIWIDHSAGGEVRLNSNVTIGSADSPVLLVVDGDLHINGNLDLYGVLYVIGDWHNSGGGTLNVTGAAIVEGDVSGTGTPNIVFDTGPIGQVVQTMGTLGSIAGGWRDF